MFLVTIRKEDKQMNEQLNSLIYKGVIHQSLYT